MQRPVLAHRQQLRAIPIQIQANAILNMNLLELQQFIETETMENPALGIDEGCRCPVCGFLTSSRACPVCGTKVQRILYAENESNYCPRCQTGGKMLSDRSLARLLKDDWPKTIDELELSKLGT